MTSNVGTIDRLFRLIMGAVLIAAPFVAGFTSTTATVIAVVAGIVLIGTAAMRFCPLYRLIGMSTCKI